jgi:hypothetical protein
MNLSAPRSGLPVALIDDVMQSEGLAFVHDQCADSFGHAPA